nr:hypothetical protein 7 [Pseudomonadaceae bacterium]
MTDQKEAYPSQNVGACPFCGENSNYVERIELNSCAVVCDCGVIGPERSPESDDDLQTEALQELDPGHVAAICAWQAAQQPAQASARELEAANMEGYDESCRVINDGLAQLMNALGIDPESWGDDAAEAAVISGILARMARDLGPLPVQYDEEENEIRIVDQQPAQAEPVVEGISRLDAIKILDRATDKEDPHWMWVVEDYSDDDLGWWPTIHHVLAAIGVTEAEFKAATGSQNIDWPQPPKAVPVMVALDWSEPKPANSECRYDHITATTPFGQFLVSWKSWKDDSGYTADETPWGLHVLDSTSLEEAKAECESEFFRRVRECVEVLSDRPS